MWWAWVLEHKGLKYVACSDRFGGLERSEDESFGREAVGFLVRNQQTIEAIRSRDPRILDILNFMLDEIDEVSAVAEWSEYGEHYNGDPKNNLDDYEAHLRIVANSKYSDRQVQQEAADRLAWVAEERQRRAERDAKRHHTKRRRSQFTAKHDELVLALINRDGYSCALCGTYEDLTIDHVIPLSRGGTDDLSNLRFLCRNHNSAKSDRPHPNPLPQEREQAALRAES